MATGLVEGDLRVHGVREAVVVGEVLGSRGTEHSLLVLGVMDHPGGRILWHSRIGGQIRKKEMRRR